MHKRILILILCAALPATALAGGYGGRYHYGGHYYRHGHGGGDEAAALIGGLVVGGLIGYLISEDRYSRRRAYPVYSYRPDPYYHGGYRDYGYREHVPVRRAPQRVVVRQDPEFAGHQCQMTREYTTTIEIDGELREAYGTKCLTPNGSWVLGRPKLAPEFD